MKMNQNWDDFWESCRCCEQLLCAKLNAYTLLTMALYARFRMIIVVQGCFFTILSIPTQPRNIIFAMVFIFFIFYFYMDNKHKSAKVIHGLDGSRIASWFWILRKKIPHNKAFEDSIHSQSREDIFWPLLWITVKPA